MLEPSALLLRVHASSKRRVGGAQSKFSMLHAIERCGFRRPDDAGSARRAPSSWERLALRNAGPPRVAAARSVRRRGSPRRIHRTARPSCRRSSRRRVRGPHRAPAPAQRCAARAAAPLHAVGHLAVSCSRRIQGVQPRTERPAWTTPSLSMNRSPSGSQRHFRAVAARWRCFVLPLCAAHCGRPPRQGFSARAAASLHTTRSSHSGHTTDHRLCGRRGPAARTHALAPTTRCTTASSGLRSAAASTTPDASDCPLRTLLFLHGNRGHAATHAEAAEICAAAPGAACATRPSCSAAAATGCHGPAAGLVADACATAGPRRSGASAD